MKTKQKKQEKGAIIVEIIAVIALLGVMGPLLFRQVSDRNEEVENINIATQMRVLKEALSSYILSYHTQIESDCNERTCTIDMDALSEFLPIGFDTILEKYNIQIIYDDNNLGRRDLQGYVTPDLAALDLPEMTLRRAARIANLIGADGGIYMQNSNEFNGTGGAWNLALAAADKTALGITDAEDSFVATTGMDTFRPTVEVEDFDPNKIILPNNLALQRLHAWDYFSVGSVENGCYELRHNDLTTETVTANNDTIFEAGATNNCDPLFWVGSSTREAIQPGDVYVKQTLHLRPSPDAGSAITLSSASSFPLDDEENNKNRKISILNVAGTEMITLDATGRIDIASSARAIPTVDERIDGRGDAEKLTIQNGRIESNIIAQRTRAVTGEDDITYGLDPRYTSVMNDIRLESRGGARLSDLLPNYILKDIITLRVDGNVEAPREVAIPACPPRHFPAIMVTPVNWHHHNTQDVIDTVVENVRADAGGVLSQTTGEIAPILPQVKIARAETITTNQIIRQEAENTAGNWNVTLTYVQNNAVLAERLDTPITAVVHTYCIYDSTNTTPTLDRPDDQR